MRRMPGVVIAIVKSLEDPEKHGRIKVEFPWLKEGEKSAWAPIATLISGKDRGSYFMPELEDEVLVAFEHGDFNHPYVVGFLWNGVDLPPHSDINPSVRRLRTVSGHTLEFDDNDGRERVLLKTSKEHQIELMDEPTAHIKLSTTGGQELHMDDEQNAISVQTSTGQKVELNPAGVTVSMSPKVSIKITSTGIDITAPTGMLNATCMQGNITANSILKITAPMTIFNGVVQTQALISQAVVSSAYSSGVPGNIFGL